MKVSKHMKITPQLVRELVHYDTRCGVLTWKPRARHWFNSDAAWHRWNNRYAGQRAFTYVNGRYRWGCLLNTNQLAHRIAWMHVHGTWPQAIAFRNGDATDLRLTNLMDRAAPPERVRLAA